MCDIKMEQSKWPTWQVRAHEQKMNPREDRAKKRARGKYQRKRGKIERDHKKRMSKSECCAISQKKCQMMNNDARGRKSMDDDGL